jgi:hypothetical protein
MHLPHAFLEPLQVDVLLAVRRRVVSAVLTLATSSSESSWRMRSRTAYSERSSFDMLAPIRTGWFRAVCP